MNKVYVNNLIINLSTYLLLWCIVLINSEINEGKKHFLKYNIACKYIFINKKSDI